MNRDFVTKRNLIAFAALVGCWLASHPAFSQTTYYRDYMGRPLGTAYTPPTVTGPYGYHGETPYSDQTQQRAPTHRDSLSDILLKPTPYIPY